MRALLLAAGLGTRLRPLTDSMPKCLAPVHGKPLLHFWLTALHDAGVGNLLVNTHYFPEQVTKFISESALARQIAQVYEPELLGTAGTLVRNIDFFEGEDGMLIHADNYCLADLTAFLAAHAARPRHCLLTMLTFRTATPKTCGIVELDRENVVKAFYEKLANPPGNLANGAVYVLSAKLLAMMTNEFCAAKDFSIDVLPHLIGQIFAWETSATFIDIGTPESYVLANSGSLHRA